MKKFSIKIWIYSGVWYSHYLSDKFIKERECYDDFKKDYPLLYLSRRSDKPAVKNDEACIWYLDGKYHRERRPAIILSDGRVEYWANGKRVK